MIPSEDDWMYVEVTSTVSSNSKEPTADPAGANSPSDIENQDTPLEQDPAESSPDTSDPLPSLTEVPSESVNQTSVESNVGKVFTKNQLLPLTFHVLSGPAQKSVQRMITVSPPSLCIS
jgi:hypothetical protein